MVPLILEIAKKSYDLRSHHAFTCAFMAKNDMIPTRTCRVGPGVVVKKNGGWPRAFLSLKEIKVIKYKMIRSVQMNSSKKVITVLISCKIVFSQFTEVLTVVITTSELRSCVDSDITEGNYCCLHLFILFHSVHSCHFR